MRACRPRKVSVEHELLQKSIGFRIPSVPREHPNALSQLTYKSNCRRFQLQPTQVPWSVAVDDYNPQEYTAQVVLDNVRGSATGGGWADPPNFNQIEEEWLRRKTFCAPHIGTLRFRGGLPRNPVGRTGISGRGLLGKWGPNHAADPIVTCRSPVTGKLCMVAIKRSDNGQWAIPGGMVDPEDANIVETMIREFKEEAAEKSEDMDKVLREIFSFRNSREIYRGYVDDPRNTDNSWMETTVAHFHCPPHLAERLRLCAGDDATGAAWVCVEDENPRFRNFYASHKQFVQAAIQALKSSEAGRV